MSVAWAMMSGDARRTSSCCTDSRAPAALGRRRAALGAERYRALAPDIRGHGAAGCRAADRLRRSAPPTCSPRRPRASLCAATRWAAGSRCTSRSRRPSASARLVLVSTTAGIEDAAERRAPPRSRRAARRRDRARVDRGRSRDRWSSQPLFAGDPDAAAAARARGHRCATNRGAGRRAARHRHRVDGAAVGPARRARRHR